jgi:Nucleotidyl transferase AbiEii toxin, Type IV TA system
VTTTTLADRIVALDAALATIPHAFGGALALAYYAEPRATIDIDVNLFVTTDRFPEVAEHLAELGIEADDPTIVELVRRDGQARVMWEQTPVDLFFAYDPFHDAASRATKQVPFAESTIPILSVEHLIVCKVVFNRPKDWVDIDAILAEQTAIDTAEVLRWTGRIVGDADPRYERIVALLTR